MASVFYLPAHSHGRQNGGKKPHDGRGLHPSAKPFQTNGGAWEEFQGKNLVYLKENEFLCKTEKGLNDIHSLFFKTKQIFIIKRFKHAGQ